MRPFTRWASLALIQTKSGAARARQIPPAAPFMEVAQRPEGSSTSMPATKAATVAPEPASLHEHDDYGHYNHYRPLGDDEQGVQRRKLAQRGSSALRW